MPFLPSLTVSKMLRYFLLLFFLTASSFSSSGSIHSTYGNKKNDKIIYVFDGEGRESFLVSSAIELNISINGGDSTIFQPDKSGTNNKLDWNSMVKSGKLSPGVSFFEIKDKNGDGLKLKVLIEENAVKKCHGGHRRSIKCEKKKTKFMGALIITADFIGKGLKFTDCTTDLLEPSTTNQYCLINIAP